MSEKGGKRFTGSGGRKSAASKKTLKNDASSRGKDDSSKKESEVQLESSDSEDSPRVDKISSKDGGKVSFKTPEASKENWGKGGKDDRMGKHGGKGGSAREPVLKVNAADLELKIEDELPKNARCLMDCEAAVILQGIQEHLSILSEDPSIKIPESFSKGLQYAKTGSHFTDPESVRQAVSSLQKSKVSQGEICQIGNIFPETVDEVYALVPSLKANRLRNENPIKDVLSELARFKAEK